MKKSTLEEIIREEVNNFLSEDKKPAITYSQAICGIARMYVQSDFHNAMGGGYEKGVSVAASSTAAWIYGYPMKKGDKDAERMYKKYYKILKNNWEKFVKGELHFDGNTFPDENLG